MKKYKVLISFKDRITKEYHSIGDVVEYADDRAEEILSIKKFIEEVVEEQPKETKVEESVEENVKEEPKKKRTTKTKK